MEEPKDFTCLMLVGFKIFSSRFVLLILSKSLRKAFLKCSFKALLHGKASIAILVSCNFFLSWSLSVYTLNQVACFMQNFFLQIVPAKMEKPDNEDIIIQIEETLHLFLWPNIITTFPPFPVMFYLPCAFICWWCCNLLTSNQDLWLVRHNMYRDPCCTE
jgi:hypothetical protein